MNDYNLKEGLENISDPLHTNATIVVPFYGMKNEPKKPKKSRPKFSFCCMEGCVQTPLIKEPLPQFKYLLGLEFEQKKHKILKEY